MEAEVLKNAMRELFIEFYGAKSEITFKDYTEEFYLPYYTIKEREHLKYDIKAIYIIIAYDWFSGKKMLDINKNDIQQLLLSIKKDRKITGATTNRYRSKLSAIFNHAINGEITISNPVKGVKKYQEQCRNRALTVEEALIFLESCKHSKNEELYDIALIALYAGMRSSEILGLTRDNIVNGCIKLEDWQTKSRYSRIIPIHPQILPMIERRATAAEKLFISKSIKTAKRNAIKRAGLEEFRFHDLRRTCATWLKDKDNNLHDISKILGHSSVTMTERYLASSPKVLKVAIDTLPMLK